MYYVNLTQCLHCAIDSCCYKNSWKHDALYSATRLKHKNLFGFPEKCTLWWGENINKETKIAYLSGGVSEYVSCF